MHKMQLLAVLRICRCSYPRLLTFRAIPNCLIHRRLPHLFEDVTVRQFQSSRASREPKRSKAGKVSKSSKKLEASSLIESLKKNLEKQACTTQIEKVAESDDSETNSSASAADKIDHSSLTVNGIADEEKMVVNTEGSDTPLVTENLGQLLSDAISGNTKTDLEQMSNNGTKLNDLMGVLENEKVDAEAKKNLRNILLRKKKQPLSDKKTLDKTCSTSPLMTETNASKDDERGSNNQDDVSTSLLQRLISEQANVTRTDAEVVPSFVQSYESKPSSVEESCQKTDNKGLTLRDMPVLQRKKGGKHNLASIKTTSDPLYRAEGPLDEGQPQGDKSILERLISEQHATSREHNKQKIEPADVDEIKQTDIPEYNDGAVRDLSLLRQKLNHNAAVSSVNEYMKDVLADILSVEQEYDSNKTTLETKEGSLLDQLIADQKAEAEDSFNNNIDTFQDESTDSDDGLPQIERSVNLLEGTDGDEALSMKEVITKAVKKSALASSNTSSKFSRDIDKIFVGQCLGIFSSPVGHTGKKKEFVSQSEKEYVAAIEAKTNLQEPINGFEDQMRFINKVWTLPVDNEIDHYEEENVGFEEHVFLDYLLDEFPPDPAIQQFMELVTNGLQQNPFLTVEQKKQRVRWFKDYFDSFTEEDRPSALGQ